MTDTAIDMPVPPTPLARLATGIRRNPTIALGVFMLAVLTTMALIAPWISGDPFKLASINRLRPPSERFWFGTDQFGRDVFARTMHGARVSLMVGFVVAATPCALGLPLRLLRGYFRRAH